MGPVVFSALLLLGLWVLIVLPQQRRVRAHRQIVDALDVGDEVMTTAGLFGTVEALEGDTMLLRVADGVTVRFVRAAVARRITDDAVDGADAVDADDADADTDDVAAVRDDASADD